MTKLGSILYDEEKILSVAYVTYNQYEIKLHALNYNVECCNTGPFVSVYKYNTFLGKSFAHSFQ